MLNIERARTIMARNHVDWLVATTPENVFYTAHFRSLGQWLMRSSRIEVLVLIPRHDPAQSILISPAQELDVAAAIPPQVSQVHRVGQMTIEPGDKALWEEADYRLANWIYDAPSHKSVYAAVERLGVIQPGQRVVLDDELTFAGLKHVIPNSAELLIAPEILEDVRVIKTAEEIGFLREGVRIAEDAIKASMAAVHTGITERELARIYDRALVDAGAVPYMTLVGIGSNGAGPNHPPVDRSLRPNELIRWDVGAEVEGYRVDMGVMAFYGHPSEKVVRYADAVDRAQTACFNEIRAGNTLSKVYQAGFDVMQAVIPNYKRKHLGHGVGVELREAPIVAPADPYHERGVSFKRDQQETANRLESGMIISLEVLYYELGLGGFQIEDTVVVTENGAERMNRLPYELIRLPVSDT